MHQTINTQRQNVYLCPIAPSLIYIKLNIHWEPMLCVLTDHFTKSLLSFISSFPANFEYCNPTTKFFVLCALSSTTYKKQAV